MNDIKLEIGQTYILESPQRTVFGFNRMLDLPREFVRITITAENRWWYFSDELKISKKNQKIYWVELDGDKTDYQLRLDLTYEVEGNTAYIFTKAKK